MQNQVQIFENEAFGKVRVVEKGGQPWWVLADVCKALGLSNPTRVAQRLDSDEKLKIDPNLELGSRSNTPVTIVSESGLYAVILRSDKPQARAFRRWITATVLPSIRAHGAYVTPETLEQMRGDTAFTEELLDRLAAERAKNGALTDTVDALQPKAQYCEAVLQAETPVCTTLIAKSYGMTAQAFNKMLQELGIQYRIGGVWFLYKAHADKGYTVTKTYYVGRKRVSIHTAWTQAGRYWLYDFLSWHGIYPQSEALEVAS